MKFFAAISYLLFSSLFVKSQGQIATDTLGGSLKKELKLAREICISGKFSFCSDGYEQPFRGSPAFVKLNISAFLDSYDSAIYMMLIPPVYEKLEKKGIKINDPFELDRLFEGRASAVNTVSFNSGIAFKWKVNRMYRKAKIQRHFDGVFKYALYKMSFECVYGGKTTVLVPGIKGTKDFMTGKECDVYYITDISSIQPISKEEYLK